MAHATADSTGLKLRMDNFLPNLYPVGMGEVLGAGITKNINRLIIPSNSVHLFGNIYVTDLLDILIIALLLYSVFLLFKRTRSQLILFGLVITLALFAFAKVFNLYLTSLVLQYFFGVFFIVFAIIFQQEIRKFFEWVGLFGSRRIKVGQLTPRSPSTSEIIQACVKMAQAKIGALIVIQGKDSLTELTEGGITLDGNISEEILLSIFDPTSEGHDGALIVSNGRITQFASHLPLSNNFKEIGKHGTRHGAALGLSELSDALCLVVSEEKGSISICKDGKMKKLDSFTDLEKELDKFIKEKFPAQNTSLAREIFSKNLGLKAIALGISALIWFFSAYQTEIIQKNYVIPVNFSKLPQDFLIESYSPKTVNLSIVGRGDVAFSDIDANDFQLNLDLSGISDGINKLDLSSNQISQPLNLTVSNIEPQTVLLTAKKYYLATIPVHIKTKGQPAKGYQIKNLAVTPESLDLLIPETASPPAEIDTDALDLTNQRESFVIPINIMLPESTKTDKTETATVNVAVTIEKI
jgi:uncharacterized protein (TIGR00159 family)